MNSDEFRGLQNSRLLIDLNGVCEILDMSESAIRKLWKSGDLPSPVRCGRRKLRWRLADIARYVNKLRPEPHPSATREVEA